MYRLHGLFALMLIALGTISAQTLWKADLAHSRVDFTVSHLVISEVTGRFTDFDVTLQQGKDDFSGSTVEATIKTASVNTDNESRDKHLRSDDFLNAEKYPSMTFVSAAFEKTGDNTFKVAGNLTIRDVTKPVVLEATLNGIVKTPWGDERAGFVATTTINRFDYGVHWDKTIDNGGLIAGKEITITLRTEFVKQKGNK
jgi:polyisoprenoid-binding protein YceI